MMLRQSITFDAPVEKVWALFADPDRWVQWNTEWAQIRDVRGPFDHAGAGYTQVLRVLRWERLGIWEVVACEPKCWREVRGTLPFGIPFRAREEFRAISQGTQMSLNLVWDQPWGVFGRIIEWTARPLLRRQLRANAARAAALLRQAA
jgi:ligand-binding SRPBCC domain-containing protein